MKNKDTVTLGNDYEKEAVSDMTSGLEGKTKAELVVLVNGLQQRLVSLSQAMAAKETEPENPTEAERQRTITNVLLKLFSEKSSRKEYLAAVVEQIQGWCGCSSVGIRVLNEEGYIPYESYIGFSYDFWESENLLSLAHDSCACIRIISGNHESQDIPWLTEGGSFHCNDMSFFMCNPEEGKQKGFRGVCALKGYRSVAVVPIYDRDKIVGAIHVADSMQGKVPPYIVAFLESVSSLIGEALRRFSVEDALAMASAYNRSLIETSLDPFVTISEEGKIDDVNSATEEVTGFSREELINTDFSDYFTDPDKARAGYQLAFRKGVVRDYELEIRHKDGHVTPVLYNASVYKDKAGKIAGVFAAARDLTEKVKLEKQFNQARKMEAIGTLAGGIAHDFNNIIAGIIGFIEMAIEDTPPDNPIARRLEYALKGAYRGRDLVKQILTFSRKGEQEKKPTSMSAIIDEVFPLIRASLPSTIEIRRKVLTASDIVPVDETLMHQVILNLCANAAHAMRDKGGILEMTLADSHIDIDNNGDEHRKSGAYLRLTISDTGSGMNPDVLERIFDPFFTTKNPGEGTGLGLSVVHGIIKSHEGIIDVESNPGQGTTFSIFIPKKDSAAPVDIDEEESLRGGTESILIIDDEELLIEMTRQRLTRLGYRVTGITDSIEALGAFKESPDNFDLVITDYTMPGMTGLELVGEMLCIRPGIPIIMCSGLNESLPMEKINGSGIKEFFAKPADKKEFALLVRNTLDRSLDPQGEI